MPSNLTDYLSAPVTVAGVSVNTPYVSRWVRLVSNSTGTAYVSTNSTDTNGMFTIANLPADTYTVYTGPTSGGAWTGTGDTNYVVANDAIGLNPLDFGAVGDGIHGDAAAFNAAVAAMPNTGGTLLITATQANVYRCEAQVLINKPNINIQFANGATLKAANSLNADLLKITGNNALVIGGIIDGNKANNTSGTGITIDAPGVSATTSGTTLLGVAVQNTIGYGINVTATGTGASTTSTIIDRCSITNTNTGIFINGRGGGGNGQVDITNVRDCVINTTVQHGMISTGANRTVFEACTVIGAGLNKVSGFSHGIAIDGNSGSNPNQEHRIANNRITTPYDAGIEVADSITACYIGGNTVLGAGNGASPSATYGIYFGGGFTLSTRAQIIGNHVTTSKGHGIMVSGVDATHLTSNVSVVGNAAVLNGNDGIFIQNAKQIQVVGNSCDGNSTASSNNFSGIDLNVVTNSTVSANVSTDSQGVQTQSRGINERGASNNNTITGNYVAGNVTSPYIVLTGAATIAWGNIGATADNGIVKGGLLVAGGIAMDGATLNAARINMPTTWGLQVGGSDAIILRTGQIVDFSIGTTALGGGAAPTFGTIGGSGPGTAGQNSWLKINIAGTTSFIPIWR